MSTSQNHHNTIEYINSHLFTLKTTINGNEIKILVDPGGDRTIISPSLLKKVATKHQGSTPLNINTITGKKKSIQANMYSFIIPSKEGDINIYGYLINQTPAEVTANLRDDLEIEWPNLNDTIRKEVKQNRFLGKVDIMIGQDNFWTLVLEGVIKHPSEKFGLLNTKLGWTVGGRISTTSPISWQQEGAEDIDIYYSNITPLQESYTEEDIRNSLVKLFETEAETTDSKHTVDEEFALNSFLKNVKQEKDGRYTVSPLFKQNFVPIRNNYYLARRRYMSLKQMMGGDQLKNKTYNEAIQQMIQNGEVEEVIENPTNSKNLERNIETSPGLTGG